jgi:hypothetical protein
MAKIMYLCRSCLQWHIELHLTILERRSHFCFDAVRLTASAYKSLLTCRYYEWDWPNRYSNNRLLYVCNIYKFCQYKYVQNHVLQRHDSTYKVIVMLSQETWNSYKFAAWIWYSRWLTVFTLISGLYLNWSMIDTLLHLCTPVL